MGKAACVAVSVGVLWLGAQATRGAEDDEKPMFYETATVYARPLSSATASVTVLGREEIEALNVLSVAELMAFVPGVNLAANGPRGGVAYAQIRGGDPNFTVVLLDGVPLNDVTDTFGGAVNLNGLSASHVERIEIVRGPVSSALGSSGLAGAINIITRHGSSAQADADVLVATGDASLKVGAVSLQQSDARHDYFAGVTWEEEEERIAEDSFERIGVQGNYHTRVGQSSAFGVTGHVSSRETDDYPESSGGPVLGDGATRHSEHDEASLGLEWQTGDRDHRHRLSTTVYHQKMDRQSPTIPPHPSNPDDFRPAAIENTVYTNLQLGWAWEAVNNETLKLNVGAEVEREDGENDTLREIFGPSSFRLKRDIGGAFAEMLLERGDLLIELGARVDVPEGFDTELSPRVGLAYRFSNENTRLRASFGRAFKLPSFFALGDVLAGNPDLEPETSVGGDVGIEQQLGNLTASFSVFEYQHEDLIDFDVDPSSPTFFKLINRDRVRSRGAELATGWKPTDALHVQLNATWQEVEDRDTGETLVHRPEWTGGARLHWTLTERWSWELDGQWIGESIDFQIPVPERNTVDGHPLYGTAVVYRLGERWELNGRADNLTDEEYETMIGFPGAERSYRVGLRRRSG